MLHKPPKTQTSTDFMRERLKKAELKFSRKEDMPRYQKVWRQTFMQLVDSDVPLARHDRDTIKRELTSHWFPQPAKERNAKHLAERDWFYRAAIKEYAKRLDVPETKAKAYYFRAWGFPSVAALDQFLKRQRKNQYKKL